VSGTITNVTDFGLFVQIHEGIDGLVHVSDISWTEHITHPGDHYKKGDVLDAVILSIDPKSRKISLGVKQLEEDPWERIEEDYPVGKVVEGTVSKVANFGAFVRLSSGVEGLVHISELSHEQVQRPEDILKVGQVEQFKVIKVKKTVLFRLTPPFYSTMISLLVKLKQNVLHFQLVVLLFQQQPFERVAV